MEVVYLVDLNRSTFEQARLTVDVVCAGDSITGWNNYGPVQFWPFPTYPHFLQALCAPIELQLVDGGIAGEISDNGLGHVGRYLELFPHSKYFIIGFGTNDLGTWPDTETTSKRIIENLNSMVAVVREQGKRPILFNVPYANESMFPAYIAQETHEKRDYHNERLRAVCARERIPLADVCSYLRDEHFGDNLHPNAAGAKIIAESVFEVLRAVHEEG